MDSSPLLVAAALLLGIVVGIALHRWLTAGAVEARVSAATAAANEKLRLLESSQATLTEQFRAIAADVTEGNARRFAEQSQTNLGLLLDPLRQRLVEFQQKVDAVYVADTQDRAALKEQVQQLLVLNRTLSDDAQRLTSALRGSVKAQGNWGELILQRLLESAGLREGFEFDLQDAQRNDDGQRQQPDCVVRLPENRRLVIDAKVSLLAFERYATADTDAAREAALREHLQSLRAHVRGLAERRYEKLYESLQGTAIDFVVLFVPIEPAFTVAVTGDDTLFADAWSRNVLLVSPSTLLFVLRTVSYLWRQEAQSRNARDIAERGAQLYDKLAGFVQDLEAVGTKLDAARDSHAAALAKLATGRGNVIRQAELLRELGVKPSKALPKGLVEAATDEGAAATLSSAAATTGASPVAPRPIAEDTSA